MKRIFITAAFFISFYFLIDYAAKADVNCGPSGCELVNAQNLAGTPWQGMSFPDGTKIEVLKDYSNKSEEKFLHLPSGATIVQRDGPLEICQKKCLEIDQTFKTPAKDTSLSLRDKKQDFEPLVLRLASVGENDAEISARRVYFNDKGWESYRRYIQAARQAYRKELSQGYKSDEHFIEGSQHYGAFDDHDLPFFGERNVLTFSGAGDVFFIKGGDGDEQGGPTLGGRALSEIFVEFKPIENPAPNAPKFLIVDYEEHIFLSAP